MRVLLIYFFVFCHFKTVAQNKYAGSYGIDAKVQEFLEEIHSYTGPPIHDLPIAIARRAMEDLQMDSTLTYNNVFFEKEIFKENGKKVNVVIVKPVKTQNVLLPILVYFHGGGWAYNSFNTHKRLMRDISLKANIAVVFVEYTKSPEVTYPIANEEGYFATLYLSKYAEKYGLDSDEIIVGGDSVGANMATAIAMMAKNRKEPIINKQVLINPVLDDNFNTNSYLQFSKGHYLSRDSMQWFWKIYAPDLNSRNLPTVAPLQASINELSNLPKALIITAEYDVLRDEGEEYAKKLREAKVPVVSARYGGTIHDFFVLNYLRNTDPSKAALEQVCDFLKNNKNKPQNNL
ncbi:alpha/beta hydrolase [Cellulophaga baltica]|uniref:alpha/beta hydrolase n=1 Tax=Cellulophaga TaxID=104264 RepID=UPI001C07EE4D|nr:MULTISPECIES: alpha/beta hydrolase [Cellulophaga]MBU2996785.1 alpha/beta hydrolase [Cellulophaga baltica]MDO6768181.1 alpha/beta hydrolase [Cellulophaga sp. 1_MG-2023]